MDHQEKWVQETAKLAATVVEHARAIQHHVASFRKPQPTATRIANSLDAVVAELSEIAAQIRGLPDTGEAAVSLDGSH